MCTVHRVRLCTNHGLSNQGGCTIERYLSVFSSAVPVQLVPSIWQAFHDGKVRDAARISAMTSSFNSSLHVPDLDDVSPPLVAPCDCCNCSFCSETLLLRLAGGPFRWKPPDTLSKMPSVKTQSCQTRSSGMFGMVWKRLSPRTSISWKMSKEGKGAW